MGSTRNKDRPRGLNHDYFHPPPGMYDDDPRSYGSQPPPRTRGYDDDVTVPRRGKSERRRPRSPDLDADGYDGYYTAKPSRHRSRRDAKPRPPPQVIQDSRLPPPPEVVSPPPFVPEPPIHDKPSRQERRHREKHYDRGDFEERPRRSEKPSSRRRRSSMPPLEHGAPYDYEPYPTVFDPRSKARPPKEYHRRVEPEPEPPRRSRRRSSPPLPPVEPRPRRDRDRRDRDMYEPRPLPREREGRRHRGSPDGGAAAAYYSHGALPSRPRARSHGRPSRPRYYEDDDLSPAPPPRTRGRPPPAKAGRPHGGGGPRPRRNSMPAEGGDSKPWWQNKTVQAGARTAAIAGAQAAFRSKDDSGPWLGPKGAKVATAALSAALVDGFLAEKRPNGSERPVLREGGNAAMNEIDKRWRR